MALTSEKFLSPLWTYVMALQYQESRFLLVCYFNIPYYVVLSYMGQDNFTTVSELA